MDDFINAVGAMAEMSAIFYKTLVSKGVPPIEAATMTQEMIRATIGGIKSGRN